MVVATAGGLVPLLAGPAGGLTTVSTEGQLRTAFATDTEIVLANDVTLVDCGAGGGDVERNSGAGLVLTGNGFTIRQTCPGQRVLRQDGAGPITLDGVTITGGDLATATAEGGGIRTGGALTLLRATVTGNHATGKEAHGAGIFAVGSVSLTGSTVSSNAAAGTEGAGDEGRGGGIYTSAAPIKLVDSSLTDNSTSGYYAIGAGLWTQDGDVTLTRSTATGNHATATSDASAGGVMSQNASMTVIDSTIADNTASGGNAGGGGIVGTEVLVVNSTVSGNATVGTDTGAGGIEAAQATLVYATIVGNAGKESANVDVSDGDPTQLVAFGTVIALPVGGPNCDLNTSIPTSNGYNYSDDASCGLGGSTDTQNGADPALGALGANGGPTPTRVPDAGSPLLDRIPDASCQSDGATGIVTDQRGFPRPAVAGCDIGAVEVQPPPVIDLQPTFTG